MSSKISDDPEVQRHYERCLRAGTSPRLAEMFACGQPPQSNTDKEFLAGHCNGSQFEKTPGLGDFYAKHAALAGVDPKGKVYLGQLADYPGDPKAWVSGRGDVAKVAEERGWSCKGLVNVKGRSAESPPPDIDVAPDIVEQAVMRAVEADPGLLEKDPGELRHDVKEKIKPHWKKKRGAS